MAANSIKTCAFGVLLLSIIVWNCNIDGVSSSPSPNHRRRVSSSPSPYHPRASSSPYDTLAFDPYFPHRTDGGSGNGDVSGSYAAAMEVSQEQVALTEDLVYDFYEKTCPAAEKIVHASMAKIFKDNPSVSAALLRLLFHDCFIEGCDASVLLDDSHGNSSHKIEKQAGPNQTLKGFDKIDMIKEELEKACPGVVSCADLLVLAARDGVVLAGGPYYPALTGRKDSSRSYFDKANAEIPAPDGNITETLRLFSSRGFSEREMVSLLGAHNIGKISCDFIKSRLGNSFKGKPGPDQTMSPGFLDEIRQSCNISENKNAPPPSSTTVSRTLRESTKKLGMTYYQDLAATLSSGSGFDTHYYKSLLSGKGLLFADQQLAENQKTRSFVSAYASDDGTTFRRDFARVMIKLSNLNPLLGSQGQVRVNCSAPLSAR